MGIPIDRDLIEDINNPSDDVIAYALKEHKKKLERFERLFNIYNNKEAEDIIKDTRARYEKVTVNHAKYVTDMNVGFIMGNPVSYTAGKENNGSEWKDKNIDPILDVYEEVDIFTHDTELEKDLSVFGEAYELQYLRLNPENETQVQARIQKIDPRGIFVVTDDTVEKTPLFAVHYMEKFNLSGESKGYLLHVYTPLFKRVKKTQDISLNDVKELEVQNHYYNDVPITEYRNNEERQGDFEQAISLMEAYNALQSDRIADKEAFIDAVLIFYGFKVEGNLKDGVVNAPSKEDGASAEWLTKTFDENSVETLAKSIEDNIHKITYVPNMNDEKFGGNLSGEAMKYKLFGLLQLLSVKERYLIRGLRHRLELMQNVLRIKDPTIDITGTKIKIKPNLPINTSDIIEQIVNLVDLLPLETLLSWLPDIDDPGEEIAKLIAEREERIRLNQKAMGTMNSHSDVETDEEDDDDTGDDS